jgi:hypothetical protein
MTTTLNVVSSKSLNDDDRSEEAAAATELGRVAMELGLAMSGPEWPLKLFTKIVLEAALKEAMTEQTPSQGQLVGATGAL